MPTASEHVAAFRQIDGLLRQAAAANARALSAYRGTPAQADVDGQFEHTLDRLAWLHGRGTLENLSTQELLRSAIDSQVHFAQEAVGTEAAEALARANALVDAARRGNGLHIQGLMPVQAQRGAYIEPLRPEVEQQLRKTRQPFKRWRNGAMLVLSQHEVDTLRAEGDRVDVLFLDSDELLDLEQRGDPAALNAELARRLAVARSAPDRVGDSHADYRVRRLLYQSTLLRNLRDRLAAAHPAAHQASLPVLAGQRAALESALAAVPPAPSATADALDESIGHERALQALVARWAAEPDIAGFGIRFKAVADAGTRLAELQRHRP